MAQSAGRNSFMNFPGRFLSYVDPQELPGTSSHQTGPQRGTGRREGARQAQAPDSLPFPQWPTYLKYFRSAGKKQMHVETISHYWVKLTGSIDLM